MPLTLADVGADCILKAFFNNTRPSGGNNLSLRLFCSNTTPAQGDVAGTYVEAAGGGYSPITLTNGSWTVTVGNDPSDAVYAARVFTFTGALTTNTTIYGFMVLDADGILQWAERLSSAFIPANNGDTLTITPKFQLSSGTPA